MESEDHRTGGEGAGAQRREEYRCWAEKEADVAPAHGSGGPRLRLANRFRNCRSFTKDMQWFFRPAPGDSYDRTSVAVCGMLVLVAFLIHTDSMMHRQIECALQKKGRPDSLVKYCENVCWAESAYWKTGSEDGHNGAQYLLFHQRMPLILLIQALCFALPGVTWSWLAKLSGHVLAKYRRTWNCDKVEMCETHRVSLAFTVLMNTAPLPSKVKRGYCAVSCGEGYYGSTLTTAYFFSKLLHLANAVLQFVFLDCCLGGGFYLFGFHWFQHFCLGQKVDFGEMFSDAFACQLSVSSLELSGPPQIEKHDALCKLTRTSIYRIILLGVWITLTYVLVITIAGTLLWIAQNIGPGSKTRFIWHHLKTILRGKESDHPLVKLFAEQGLRHDGVFCLKIIQDNHGEAAATRIIGEVWKSWIDPRRIYIKFINLNLFSDDGDGCT